MGEKAILILDGYSEGKNKFKEILKEGNFWFWNINSYNVLHMIAHKLGYEGERNKNYYDFIENLKNLSDDFFGFEREYTLSMIKKFEENDRVNVLIIHNCDQNLAIELQDFYSNCFDVLIANEELENSSYCKTLNYKDEKFTDKVLEMMKILTKSFNKE